jgi:flagellar hook-basal body complex protein FliE
VAQVTVKEVRVMSELRINNLGGPLKPEIGEGIKANQDRQDSFEIFLKEAIGKLQQIQSDAEKAVKELATGGDITQAVIAMQKVELSFQLMVEVRNRLIIAYEEIQRMQI